MEGKKFHRWTVIERAGKIHGDKGWLCRCECGTERVVGGASLRIGNSKSCGCYRADWSRENKTIHGMNRVGKPDSLYTLWCKVKGRCLNPNDTAYKDYGGRGITLCNEWMEFIPFMEWANANGYQHGLEIDRIDNNKGYHPDNCHFTTRIANARNKRSNVLIEHEGVTKTVTEWAQDMDVDSRTLFNRLYLGWSHKDVLVRPLRKRAQGL